MSALSHTWNITTGNFYIDNIESEYRVWKRKIAIENILFDKNLDDSYKSFSMVLPFQKEYWL